MSPLILFVIFLFLLMLLGIPIGFSFAIAGFTGLVFLRGFDPALSLIGAAPYTYTTMESLIPLPLFILMGFFAFKSGISADLFDTANKWMGRLPGGLAIATTAACAFFAACTGDSVSGATAMGTIAYPEMEKHGYSQRLSTGCIVAGGSLGILIPPSGVFIIYGFLTQTSIGALFIAGIIPGIILSLFFMLQIYLMCVRDNRMGPPGQSFTWRERFTSINGSWPAVLLFLIIIGGLYFGVFAPSEAGAIGAFAAFIIALSKRRLKKESFADSLVSTLKITSFVFTLIVGAMIFNTFLSVSGASALLRNFIAGLQMPTYLVLAVILIMYIVLGMVMDCMAMILLTVPIVYPVITSMGFDLVWFGIILVILAEMALITPPVAVNIYAVQGVTGAPFSEISKGILPFVATMIVVIIILVIFPDIVTFLPKTMLSR
jgi:C4-dicarboxylate transporter, DctM subunit